MLNLFRRHTKQCIEEHGKDKGRRYRRCKCPLHVEGTLAGVPIRKALDLTSWDAAERQIREWNVTGKIGGVLERNESFARAIELYLADAVARKLSLRSVSRYRYFLERSLLVWCEKEGLRHIREMTFEKAAKYRASWESWGAYTAAKNLELFRMFLRFCKRAKWIDENPAEELKGPKIQMRPTLPFTEDEERAIFATCDSYRTNNRHGKRSPARLLAFVMTLRYTGMRIGDVATLPVSKLEGNSILLYTHKTGIAVYVPIPPFVGDALREQAGLNSNPEYFFWTGVSTVKCASVLWMRTLKTLCRKAGVPHGHAHMWRDTFAVSLLLQGVPIEDVATLLGHATPAITAKHYSPWVQARREKLEALVQKTWPQQPQKFKVIEGGA